MYRIVRISRYLIIALLIAGCPSVQLLNANQEFVSLMQQSAEAERLVTDGTLDQHAFESTTEALQTAFKANGDVAVQAARDAGTDQSKASLFNVAVRSYLKSGAVGDAEIPGIADEGIQACSRMTGLDALPTTCGYFHIVVPQAANNEWRRSVDVIKWRQDALALDEMLSVEDGKTLVTAAGIFFGQLDALDEAENKIDWANAGEGLRDVFVRQQDIFFCNGRAALISLPLVEESGDEWDRKKAIEKGKELDRKHLEALEQRDGGFPAGTCSSL